MTIPKHLDNFFSSLIFNIILPFLPLLIEFLYHVKINQETLVLFATVYALLISTKSSSSFLISFGVLSGTMLSAVYAVTLIQQRQVYSTSALSIIFIISILHGFEKWNLHVLQRRPFLILDSNTSYETINFYSNIEHELNRFSNMLPKLFESSMEKIPSHLSRTIENLLHEEFTQLREKLIKRNS